MEQNLEETLPTMYRRQMDWPTLYQAPKPYAPSYLLNGWSEADCVAWGSPYSKQ